MIHFMHHLVKFFPCDHDRCGRGNALATQRQRNITALLAGLLLIGGCHQNKPDTEMPFHPIPQPLRVILKELRPNGEVVASSGPAAGTITLECAPGQGQRLVARNQIAKNGEWSLPWPPGCSTRGAEVRVQVMVNPQRCEQATLYDYPSDIHPGEQISLTALCRPLEDVVKYLKPSAGRLDHLSK